MRYKVGIYGSAAGSSDETNKKAVELGNEIAKYDITIITGAGHGVPYLVATAAKKANKDTIVWGFPPTTNEEELIKYMPQADLSIYQKLFYVPSNFQFVSNKGACRQYRNFMSTVTADAGIIIAGRWGATSEFAALREMGKVIGVLTGTGGLADEIEELSKRFNKKSESKVVFNDSPTELIKQVIEEIYKGN